MPCKLFHRAGSSVQQRLRLRIRKIALTTQLFSVSRLKRSERCNVTKVSNARSQTLTALAQHCPLPLTQARRLGFWQLCRPHMPKLHVALDSLAPPPPCKQGVPRKGALEIVLVSVNSLCFFIPEKPSYTVLPCPDQRGDKRMGCRTLSSCAHTCLPNATVLSHGMRHHCSGQDQERFESTCRPPIHPS